MLKTILLSFVMVTGMSFYTHAQHPTALNELTDSIETLIKKHHIAGLMLGITTKDSTVFSGGFGYADIDEKRKTNSNTLFRLGSITKMFISISIMKLVEDHKLHLNDELKHIAPEIPFTNKWEKTHPIRIVHLLEHTTGFDDMKLNRLYTLDTAERRGLAMVLVQKNSLISRWTPGERMAYSNPNYAILGYIIEKLSGKPYDQYIQEIILKPLHMNNTNFNVRSKLPLKETREYTVDGDVFIAVPSVTLLSGPQGSLWSTADDMVEFLRLFLRDGFPILSRASITEIETPHSSFAARKGLESCYALGNRIGFINYKYPFRGHDGLAGTCYSSCFYNRDLDIGFVIAANSNQYPHAIEQAVINYIEKKLPQPTIKTQPLDIESVQPFLGYYKFESPRNEIASLLDKFQKAQHVYSENGALYIKQPHEKPARLLQTSALTFTYEGANTPLIVFGKNGDENAMSIAGTYYIQHSSVRYIVTNCSLVAVILLTLSVIILGIQTIYSASRKKMNANDIFFRVIPAVSLVMLLFAIQYLVAMKTHSYRMHELGSLNIDTLGVFLSTLFFGVTSFMFLLYASFNFRRHTKRVAAWYLLITAIAMNTLTFILWRAGWIGMATWMM